MIRARLRTLLPLLTLVAGIAACSRGISGLGSFPCAADGTCPDGLACLGAIGCASAALGGECQAHTDCSRAAPGASCVDGRCQRACADGAGCGGGTVCSAGHGPGYCVAPCDGPRASCPYGNVCRELWREGLYGCADASLPILGLDARCPATGLDCAEAAPGTSCLDDRCEPPCVDGAGCPPGRVCSTSTGAGACLTDCSTIHECPWDLRCTPLYHDLLSACSDPTASYRGVDAPCATANDCAGIAGTSCIAGRCVPGCVDGAGCAAGRVCSSASGAGGCLIDCTDSGTTCPYDLACSSLYWGGHRGCADPSARFVGVDAPCAGDSDCAGAGAGVACRFGRCVPACDAATNGCAAGRECTAAVGPGACFLPCGAGGACPYDLACVSAPSGASLCAGLAKPIIALDEPCTTNADCVPIGATCFKGRCELACSSPVAAGDPATCTSVHEQSDVCSGETSGACLAQCTLTGTCPPDLACKDLWHDGARGCVDPGATIAACAGVDTLAQCQFCGASYWNVSCGNGSFCPDNSHCSGGYCYCASGYTAVTCDGRVCGNGVTCNYPNYWCRPKSAITSTCSSTGGKAAGNCRCVDGRTFTIPCGTTESCEHRCSVGCDTVAQDCPFQDRTKCTVVFPGGKPATQCLAPTGTQPAGASCTRTTDGAGYDDCARGLFCSGTGLTGASRACRPLCRADSTCSSGTRCMALSYLTPNDGICVQTCGLFSTTCGAGRTCGATPNVATTWMGYCRAAGTYLAGWSCSADEDCAANLACVGGKCHALCDSGHPCTTGTCTANTGLPSGGGICP